MSKTNSSFSKPELCWAVTPVHNENECCWCDYLRDLEGYYDQ